MNTARIELVKNDDGTVTSYVTVPASQEESGLPDDLAAESEFLLHTYVTQVTLDVTWDGIY